jgi:hypothetical protein
MATAKLTEDNKFIYMVICNFGDLKEDKKRATLLQFSVIKRGKKAAFIYDSKNDSAAAVPYACIWDLNGEDNKAITRFVSTKDTCSIPFISKKNAMDFAKVLNEENSYTEFYNANISCFIEDSLEYTKNNVVSAIAKIRDVDPEVFAEVFNRDKFIKQVSDAVDHKLLFDSALDADKLRNLQKKKKSSK